ncbi:MAG: hypothetical protein J0L87_10465 [Bacteroidetes bacterium]|nr:hypothetical protein [Bacteroidota bacterium]
MTGKIRHYENLHIPLWLLKDTCWMMQWKIMGITMIIPTVLIAVIIAIKTWQEKSDEFWINLAICMWITANSYWMLCEFFHHEELKNYAGIPFVMGMIAVSIFYIKRIRNKRKKDFL